MYIELGSKHHQIADDESSARQTKVVGIEGRHAQMGDSHHVEPDDLLAVVVTDTIRGQDKPFSATVPAGRLAARWDRGALPPEAFDKDPREDWGFVSGPEGR